MYLNAMIMDAFILNLVFAFIFIANLEIFFLP